MPDLEFWERLRTLSETHYVVMSSWKQVPVAVFSDRALADRFVAVTALGPFSKGDGYRVLEAPLNPFLGPLACGLKPFAVHTDGPDGLDVRIDPEPSDTTVWANEPDAARMIARLRP